MTERKVKSHHLGLIELELWAVNGEIEVVKLERFGGGVFSGLRTRESLLFSAQADRR